MQAFLAGLSLVWLFVFFAGLAAVVGFAGTHMAKTADRLADRTGLGETLMGAVFIGASTSLSGITTSVTAAASGAPTMAISNTIGGIAVQTAFLALADLTSRDRANLLVRCASPSALYQGVLQLSLLTLALLGALAPPLTLWSISPASPVLLLAYLTGLYFMRGSDDRTIHDVERPAEERDEAETKEDPEQGPSTGRLWAAFALDAALTTAAGWGIGQVGLSLIQRTGLSESAVGGLLTAITTSLPELVTVLGAVRRRAYDLATGDILGGNCFDVLFLAASDVGYRDGSLFAHFAPRMQQMFLLTILLVSVLLLGMLRTRRKRVRSWAGESVAVVVLYLVGAVVLASG